MKIEKTVVIHKDNINNKGVMLTVKGKNRVTHLIFFNGFSFITSIYNKPLTLKYLFLGIKPLFIKGVF